MDMDSLNIEYKDLKKELKADAEYWTTVVTPFPGDHIDSLDYEDMLYDDYSENTDVQCQQ